jgi:hypothetical protein
VEVGRQEFVRVLALITTSIGPAVELPLLIPHFKLYIYGLRLLYCLLSSLGLQVIAKLGNCDSDLLPTPMWLIATKPEMAQSYKYPPLLRLNGYAQSSQISWCNERASINLGKVMCIVTCLPRVEKARLGSGEDVLLVCVERGRQDVGFKRSTCLITIISVML